MIKSEISKSKSIRFILLSLFMLMLMSLAVHAQTGIFSISGGNLFITFGIVALVAAAIIKIIIDSMKK